MKPLFRPTAIALLFLVLILSACSPASPSPTNPPLPSPSVPTATPTDLPSPTNSPLPSPTATTTPSPIFRDDFSSDLLPGWTWIQEDKSLWDLTTKTGYLHIVLQKNPLRNLPVRDVTSENFQIVTHVLFTPTSNFQIAGLLVYQDDQTIAQLGRAFCDIQNVCVGNGIYFEGSQSGKYVGPNLATNTQVKDEAYLRIDKIGSVFTGYYSEDGENWTLIGAHEFSMASPKVGFITGNSSVAGMTADFDYFIYKNLP